MAVMPGVRMGLQHGLQMHHPAFFHHGTDGRHLGLVDLGGIGDGDNLNPGSFLEFPESVLQDVEAYFQMLGINDIKERDTGRGRAVQRGVDAAIDRHFGDGLDGSLAGKAFGLYRTLEIPVLYPDGVRRNGLRLCLDRRKGSRLPIWSGEESCCSRFWAEKGF